MKHEVKKMQSLTTRFLRVCAQIQDLLHRPASILTPTSSHPGDSCVPFGWIAGALLTLLDSYESGLGFPALLEQLQRDWDRSCSFGSLFRVSLSKLYRSNQLLKNNILDLSVTKIVTVSSASSSSPSPSSSPSLFHSPAMRNTPLWSQITDEFPMFSLHLVDKKHRSIELLIVGKFARLLLDEQREDLPGRWFGKGSRLRLTGAQLRATTIRKTGLLQLLPTAHMAIILLSVSALLERRTHLSATYHPTLQRKSGCLYYFLAARVLAIRSYVSVTPRGCRTTIRSVELAELATSNHFALSFVGDDCICAANLFGAGDVLGIEAPAVVWPESASDDDDNDEQTTPIVEYDPHGTLLWVVHTEDDVSLSGSSQMSQTVATVGSTPPPAAKSGSIVDYALTAHPLDISDLHASMINVALFAVVHKIKTCRRPNSDQPIEGLRLRLGSVREAAETFYSSSSSSMSSSAIMLDKANAGAKEQPSLSVVITGAQGQRLAANLRLGITVLIEGMSTPRRLSIKTSKSGGQSRVHLELDPAAIVLRAIDTIPGILSLGPLTTPGLNLLLESKSTINATVRATIVSIAVGPLGSSPIELVHSVCHTPVLLIDSGDSATIHFCPLCRDDLDEQPEYLYNLNLELSDRSSRLWASPLPAAALFLMNLPAETMPSSSAKEVLQNANSRLLNRDFCFLLTRTASTESFHISVACSSESLPLDPGTEALLQSARPPKKQRFN